MPTLLLAAVAALALQSTASPDVQVEPLGEGNYRLTVTVEGTTDPAVAQRALAPRAMALCAGLPVQFGRYRFEADDLAPGQPAVDHVASVTLVQDLACGAAVASLDGVRPPAPILAEAEIQRLNPQIQALTDRFFKAADEGRDAESWTLVSADMTGNNSASQWAAGEAARRAITGPLVSRQVAKLTWYQNPPSAEPGHYVAVDYVAYGQLQDACGYLVWFRPNGSTPFLLARQETTLVPHDLDDSTRQAIRQQYCIIV